MEGLMRRLIAIALLAALPCPTLACSLCGGSVASATMRQDAAQAKIIVIGSLKNARLDANSSNGSGLTDFKIEHIVKGEAALKGVREITIPRYLPSDEKSPKFLLRCDLVN